MRLVRTARFRRLALIAALYLVSDIGYSFFWGAFNTILLGQGISLERLALINLLGVAYFARFLVGPVVDRYGWRRFGHYRSWLVGTQLALIGALLALVPLDPVANLPAVLAVLVLVFLISAFHDTAMGGLAVRILPADERGTANGVQTGAASLSIVIGSGGALLLYAHAGWSVTVGALALIFVLPLTVLARFTEPAAPRSAVDALPRPGAAAMLTFFRSRRATVWTLVVVPVFALGVYLASVLQAPMLVAADWSLDRIALVQNVAASTGGVLAALLTGQLIRWLGRGRSVLVVGLFSAGTVAALFPLAYGEGRFGPNAVAVVAISVGYAAKSTWVLTIAMDLARQASAATDFTLQVSVLGILRLAIGSIGLALAGWLGFPVLIAVSVGLALVGAGVAVWWTAGHRVRLDAETESLEQQKESSCS